MSLSIGKPELGKVLAEREGQLGVFEHRIPVQFDGRAERAPGSKSCRRACPRPGEQDEEICYICRDCQPCRSRTRWIRQGFVAARKFPASRPPTAELIEKQGNEYTPCPPHVAPLLPKELQSWRLLWYIGRRVGATLTQRRCGKVLLIRQARIRETRVLCWLLSSAGYTYGFPHECHLNRKLHNESYVVNIAPPFTLFLTNP